MPHRSDRHHSFLHHGNTTIYVSDMAASLEFYLERLGFTERMRAADPSGTIHWAEVDAGGGMVIGLHPTTPHAPKPGTAGSLSLGFMVTGTIDEAVEGLTERGVLFEGAVQDDGAVKLAHFSDPDGNPLYLFQVMHGC